MTTLNYEDNATTEMNSTQLVSILNSVIEGVKSLSTKTVSKKNTQLVNELSIDNSIGVMIGITGDVSGTLVINCDSSVMLNFAKVLYNIDLSTDMSMLQSFSSEIGNLIGGKTAIYLSNKEIAIDITPPTLIEGTSTIRGFTKGIRVNLDIADIGEFSILVLMKLSK